MMVDLEPRPGFATIEDIVEVITESLRHGYCSVAVTGIGCPTVYHMRPTEEGARWELLHNARMYQRACGVDEPEFCGYGEREMRWKANGQEGVLKLTTSEELDKKDHEELERIRRQREEAKP